jgi:hypothetical protein
LLIEGTSFVIFAGFLVLSFHFLEFQRSFILQGAEKKAKHENQPHFVPV